MRIHIYLLLIFSLSLFACNRPDLNPELIEWEDYQDKVLTQDDFDEALSASQAYDLWDADDNTYISREEFYDGYFQLWDRNSSGAIEAEEWHNDKLPNNTRTADLASGFAKWDADDDGLISPAELQNPLQEKGYFGYLDDNDNGRLNHVEVSNAMFNLLDQDGNGTAEPDEYNLWLETELDMDTEEELEPAEGDKIY
jgi:Ca2+-binding EF-hand superfamily protein